MGVLNMAKVIKFLKTKAGKAVLAILAILATLTATGLDDKAVQVVTDYVESQPIAE